ncbi:MAG: hypothetical protein RR280_01380 [Bacteroidaceae bacterium]
MISFSATLKKARFDAIATAISAGASLPKMNLYAGTRPANMGSPTSGNTLICTVVINRPVYKTPQTGMTATINTALESTVLADGVPTWCRIFDGSNNPMIDLDVGDGLDVQVNQPSFVAGSKLTVSALNITEA